MTRPAHTHDEVKAEPPKNTRSRFSENALQASLKAVVDAGLSVHKVCVNGGQLEIFTQPVDEPSPPHSHRGPKKW